MNNAFLPRIKITESEKLFGRKDLIKQLTYLANNGNSVSIIGLRRFGKSCLLESLVNDLSKLDNSKVYPIYFDFKEVGSLIKGTDNVYRYMISKFVEKLSKEKIFNEEFKFKNITINASEDWEDLFENLDNVNTVRIQGLFTEIVLFFSEYLDKTVLFVIDEYEYLFRFIFDDPVGFMKLRNFSEMTLKNGLNPFCFWISGSITWRHLCTLTGSPELNVIDTHLYLDSIDFDSFNEMWLHEISLIKDCPEILKEGAKFAFDASGGVPFYGKLIGNHWLTHKVKPSHDILIPYFQELLSILKSEEMDILYELSKSPKELTNSQFLLELLNNGLVIKHKNKFEIKITFLKDYIKEIMSEKSMSTNKNLLDSEILTDKVIKLIYIINNTYHNKKHTYIFLPVNDEALLVKDLKNPCYTRESFSDFSSSLYKIVFERTKKGNTNKALLPLAFQNKEIIDIIDIMRHSLGGGHLMDTFTRRPGQMTKPQMIHKLVGHRNDPSKPEDFYALQIAVLKLFENYLIELEKHTIKIV